jgi:predicted ATPase
VPSESDGLVFQQEECAFEKQRTQGIWTEDLGSGHAESTLSERATYRPVVSCVLDGLGSWVVYHFHDTSDSARVRKSCDLADNKRLRPDASNLAAFLYFLKQKHPGEYRNIVDTIRLTAPFLDDFVLEPDRLKPDTIRLAWRHTQSDRYFGPPTLSDGTLRFTCLATLLLQPDLPTTILMDEPELGLHPQAIGLLAELMKSAATRTQIVVATQSVTLVNHFEPKDIVVVEQRNGRSLFRRLSDAETSEWLDDYGVGDLWEKNLLGGRP